MKTAYAKEFPYLYRGVVEDNIDPKGLGRCKIRVPAVHGELNYPIDILPWARPLVLSPVKQARGSVNLPDKGDIVWVFFEGAVKEFPVYLGGTYAKGDLEVLNERVDFYIENDDKISYHRVERKYTIDIGETHVEVTPQDVTIYAPRNIYVEAGEHITMKAPRIDLNPDEEIPNE